MVPAADARQRSPKPGLEVVDKLLGSQWLHE